VFSVRDSPCQANPLSVDLRKTVEKMRVMADDQRIWCDYYCCVSGLVRFLYANRPISVVSDFLCTQAQSSIVQSL
jgi:hypothetical protein